MSASENWDLRVDDAVNQYVAKFPQDDVRRIFEVIESLRSSPYAGDIEKLKGEENKWRRRVGVYRIFFKIYQHPHVVLAVKVERRGSHTN